MEALQGADILGLIACGVCFGVAFVGLIGRLKVRGDSSRMRPYLFKPALPYRASGIIVQNTQPMLIEFVS